MLFSRIPARPHATVMTRREGRAGSSVRQRRCGGAPGGASSPFRPPRNRTGFPRARSPDGSRNSVRQARGYGQGAGLAILRSAPTAGLATPSGVSRRSIPLSGKRKKGTGGARAETNNRAAQRWLKSMISQALPAPKMGNDLPPTQYLLHCAARLAEVELARVALLQRRHHAAHVLHGGRAGVLHQGENRVVDLLVGHLLRQIFLDDRNLLALLRDKIRAPAFLVKLGGLVALLDHLLQHPERLIVGKRGLALPARLDVGVLQRRVDEPQGRDAARIALLHGVLQGIVDVVAQHRKKTSKRLI